MNIFVFTNSFKQSLKKNRVISELTDTININADTIHFIVQNCEEKIDNRTMNKMNNAIKKNIKLNKKLNYYVHSKVLMNRHFKLRASANNEIRKNYTLHNVYN